jgi:hypothetical protein
VVLILGNAEAEVIEIITLYLYTLDIGIWDIKETTKKKTKKHFS